MMAKGVRAGLGMAVKDLSERMEDVEAELARLGRRLEELCSQRNAEPHASLEAPKEGLWRLWQLVEGNPYLFGGLLSCLLVLVIWAVTMTICYRRAVHKWQIRRDTLERYRDI